MRQGDLARVWDVAAAHQLGVRIGAMRGAEGAAVDQGRVWRQLVGDRIDAVQGNINARGEHPIQRTIPGRCPAQVWQGLWWRVILIYQKIYPRVVYRIANI